jgi:hypothetical protein
MDNLPTAGFYFEDIYCYPSVPLKERRFECVPSSPIVELAFNGTPIATLLDSPEAAILMVQSIWRVDSETFPRLRQELEKRYPGTRKLDLSLTPFSKVDVTLTVTADNRASHTFGPQPSSGFEPYRAVFSETLTVQEKQAAIAAFNGRENCLKINYEATWDMMARVRVQVEGDIAEDLKALAPKKTSGWNIFSNKQQSQDSSVTLEKCRAQVDRSIQAGRLTLTHEATPSASDKLRSEVENEVKNKVANEMLRQIQQLGANAGAITSYSVNHSNQGSEKLRCSVSRSLDIGKWFQSHKSSSPIQYSPAPISNPER